MNRDITNIVEAECITIVDDKTIQSIDSGRIQTYKLISNKYYQTDNSPYTPLPGQSRTCYTQTQLENLQSPFDFITPVYHLMAIASALLIFYAAYKLMIYPWFRTKI